MGFPGPPGITAFLAGLALLWLSACLILLLRRRHAPLLTQFSVVDAWEADPSPVVIVQPGGKAAYVNDAARECFGVLEEKPDLEQLASRTHPREVFLTLCTAPGQARFKLNGRLFQAEAHSIPYADGGALVLSFNPVSGINRGDGGVSASILNQIKELSLGINPSLELNAILLNILESSERLLAADQIELALLDQAKQCLVFYQADHDLEGCNRLLKVRESSSLEKGLTTRLLKNGEPLRSGSNDPGKWGPGTESSLSPFQSYIGFPLKTRSEVFGALEFSAYGPDAFSESDFIVCRFIADQAAAAIHHARLFQAEARRSQELSGLVQLTQAVKSLNDPRDLFARLLESLLLLLPVEMAGFWLYNEAQHRLEAQTPFIGLPEEVTSVYYIPIEANSEAEAIVLSQEVILSGNAAQDSRLEVLQVAHLAQAAGIANTVLAPLVSGGRMVGYLHVSEKKNGEAFTQDDLSLLTAAASQAAVIIENAALVVQTQRRARRSEALRRIASLTASSATMDEVLQYSLRELSRLLQADVAAAFLLDDHGSFRLHRPSVYGISTEWISSQGRSASDWQASRFSRSESGSPRAYLAADAFEDLDALPLYRELLVSHQLRSVINLPLVVQERTIGELIVASRIPNYYDQSDVIVIGTAASQLAGAIQQFSLSRQTDHFLRQRVDTLTSLARLSREFNSSLEVDQILGLLFDELLEGTRSSCGTIALFDEQKISGGFRLSFQYGETFGSELTPIERDVLEQGAARTVEYILPDLSVSGSSLFGPPHENICSSLILPIIYQDRAEGIVHLHSETPGHFDEASLEIAQSLVKQAAAALRNAQRWHEERAISEQLAVRAQTLAQLFDAVRQDPSQSAPEDSLEVIAAAIQHSAGFDQVVIYQVDPRSGCLHAASSAGLSQEQWQAVRQENLSWDEIHLLQRSGGSLALPPPAADGSPILLPLTSPDAEPLGAVALFRYGSPAPLSKEQLEIAAGYTEQAAGILQIHASFRENCLKVEQLENAVRFHETSQTNLPELIQKDLEHTQTLQELSQRTLRIRAGLDIAEILNHQPDRQHIIEALAGELLTRMDLHTILAAEPSSGEPRILHMAGTIPRGVNPEALLGQRNPLRYCIQSRRSVFSHDLSTDKDWTDSPLLASLEAAAFFCLVIPAGGSSPNSGAQLASPDSWNPTSTGEPEAVLLAVSREAWAPFSLEDEQILALLARQTSAALHNQRLLSETNRRFREVNLLLDFTRQLGSLNPQQILHTLADSVLHLLPSAQACMVALWDAREQCLIPHAALGYANNGRMKQIRYRLGEGLPGLVFESGRAVRVDEVDFARHYSLSSASLVCYREAAAGNLPLSNLVLPISPPLHSSRGHENHNEVLPLGVLVLDNFHVPAAFTLEDLALASSLTQQTALTLENARLLQASEQRAVQLHALTQAASTITSSLQTEELTAALLDQAGEVLPYDTGTLWIRHGEHLVIRAAQGFVDSDERTGISTAIEDSQLLQEMVRTGQPIFVEDTRQDPRFPVLEGQPPLTWLGVPLMSKGAVTGVIALEKQEAASYTPEHIQAAIMFASQAAVALENARLYEDSLQRMQELDQHSTRLALLNRLSSELIQSMNPDFMLGLTCNELRLALNCSSVSAVLFNQQNEAFLTAETPQASERLRVKLPDAGIFSRLRQTLGIFKVDDIRNLSPDQVELVSALEEYLESRLTRGLMAIPLTTGTDLHGVVFVHQERPYRFSSEEVELARTITNQSAVAVQNARLLTETRQLYAETRRRSDELASLFGLSARLSETLDEQTIIGTVFSMLSGLIGVDSIALVLKNEAGELSAEIIDQGERIGPIQINASEASLSQRVIKTGSPLIIGDVFADDEFLTAAPAAGGAIRSWLGVPLVVRGVTTGVISVQSPVPDQFSEEQARLVGQSANQLAAALDNTRLISTVQNYAADLEKRVIERTAQLEREHQRKGTLLSIISELSTSLDMDIVLSRTLELVHAAIKAEHSQIVLRRPEESKLILRATSGYTKPLARPGEEVEFSSKKGLAGWVIRTRKAVLIPDLANEAHWSSQDDETHQHKSAIAAPLMMGPDALGALLLFHNQTNQFTPDQLELVQAIAQQIAVAVNNAQLFNLIRDQAEHQGEMLRQQHVETSRSQAILEAVADGVIVTDAHRFITLFNASAEQILGLPRQQVLGRSLDSFLGLFGKASQSWEETIRTWTEAPFGHHGGDLTSEQIELDDRRVISVHMSPVFLRKDFLGTVSTFRDITHQVEVDRLKSEFVATVSHELRTPMTAIKGFVEVLLMDAAGPLNDQQAHFLTTIKNNTERLAVLVSDLLDISKIETGKAHLSLQNVDLRKISEEAVSDLRQRIKNERRNLVVEQKARKNLLQVQGDPERIRQVVDILLENAFLYTPDDGRIILNIFHSKDEIQVDIEDSGIGIPLPEQKRIFERFYRGEDPLVLASAGTGLGLSIVQRLVEMHGGRIWVTSSGIRGEGSTFSFTLPLAGENARLRGRR
jgi:PAS domain S-box-containing protein